jgi:hypothetical protein
VILIGLTRIVRRIFAKCATLMWIQHFGYSKHGICHLPLVVLRRRPVRAVLLDDTFGMVISCADHGSSESVPLLLHGTTSSTLRLLFHVALQTSAIFFVQLYAISPALVEGDIAQTDLQLLRVARLEM